MPTPRNISKARQPKWTGQPGEAAIVVSRGEPSRDDRQMEEVIREQVFAYLDEHVPDRQVDQLVRFATVHLIVEGHVWPRNGVPRGGGVMLTREHLLGFVDEAQRRIDRARCTCSTWWVDPYTGREYDQGGGGRELRRSLDPECRLHGKEQ